MTAQRPLPPDPLRPPGTDEVYDPAVGAWVPRPSALWAVFAGLGIGVLIGIGVHATVLAASPAAAEPFPAVRSQPEAPSRYDVAPLPSSTIGNGAASVTESPDPTTPPEAPIAGFATWYCSASSPCTRGYGPGDQVAAIDPTTGIRRGELVRVTSGGRSVTVTIVDVCACHGARVVDLTSGAFRRLAPLSRGVIPVVLERLPAGATVPPTDEELP